MSQASAPDEPPSVRCRTLAVPDAKCNSPMRRVRHRTDGLKTDEETAFIVSIVDLIAWGS
jgi:hypothetical protein